MDLLQQQTYILIPVHNRKQITLRCLENLQQCLDIDQFTIIVIDDGSTDGTSDAIQTLYPHIKVLNGDGSLWWTGAIAIGMKHAYQEGADYIIWLNDDCELQSQTLSALIKFCKEHPNAIVGAQGFEKECPEKIAFGGKRKTWKGFRYIQASASEVIPCDLLSGNIVCLPSSVIDKIGFPNTQLTPHYGGDSLYLIKAHQNDFHIYIDGRYPATNLPGETQLYPNDWLHCTGEPSRLLKLMFNPYSGLSWRVWLALNWKAYSLWGLIMFTKKYIYLFLITLQRYIYFYLFQHTKQKTL